MSELRKDPITNRWVIIAPERGARPQEFSPEPDEDLGPANCPFCEGNERMTPKEVFAIRDHGEPDQPGWYVRVVPNKFPCLRIEGELEPGGTALFQRLNGIGAHEIVIENPDHRMDLAFAPEDQIIRVLTAYCERAQDLRGDPRFRHIIVFRNHRRAAGATLGHPHSQIVALPIVPKLVAEETEGASAYYHAQGGCAHCQIMDEELAAGDRVVAGTEHFVALAPYASRFACETVLYPRRHCHDFSLMTPGERADLAALLRRLLAAYRMSLFDPPYNFVFQTAPLGNGDLGPNVPMAELEQCCHWHLSIMPRLATLAGFEWGTGFYVNTVAPEVAAKLLRDNLA